MCTATPHCRPRLPSLRSLLSLHRHTHHTHTYTVTAHELSQSQSALWALCAHTPRSNTRRRRWRWRRHPPGRARCRGARPAARLLALAALARCGARRHGHLRLWRRRRPGSTEVARAREGFGRRLASPRLVGRPAPVDPCRTCPRGARAVRDRLGRCSCAGRRGGRGDPARGRGARERADGLGVLVQLTRCAPAARDGSRHARVVLLGGARAGRHPRLGAPERGASESPRWSGRAVGSRRTVWRLGGRCERPFAGSPSVDHPRWITPNDSPGETDSQDSASARSSETAPNWRITRRYKLRRSARPRRAPHHRPYSDPPPPPRDRDATDRRATSE